MLLILLVMLAGALAANPTSRLETTFENPIITIGEKLIVQLHVSLKPAEEVALRRQTVSTNQRRPNEEEMLNNVTERFSSQLASRDAIVRTEVATKNRTASQGRRRTITVLPKNRFSRLSTTTSRYPTSKFSEDEDHLPWESQRTQNVTAKGSRQQVLNRMGSTPSSRPRHSRIRTTPVSSSKDFRRSHFVVEQRRGNPTSQSRARQNQTKDPTATAVNSTLFQLQKAKKDADAIDRGIAVGRNEKIEQVQIESRLNSDASHSKREDHISEESQAEAPVSEHPVAEDGSLADQVTATTEIVNTPIVAATVKLPVPFNRRKAITRESQTSDKTTDSERQVLPVKHMVSIQSERDSTATDRPVSKSLRDTLLLERGYYVNHQEPLTASDKDMHFLEKNKTAHSYELINSQETATSMTMTAGEVHTANATNDSVLNHHVNESQLRVRSKSDEPIFRHSVGDRDFSGQSTPLVDDLKIAMPFSHINPVACGSKIPDEMTNEPSTDRSLMTEILTMQIGQEQAMVTGNPASTSEDVNHFQWKDIGDIAVQMNPNTKEVINIKSQTASGVHFIMATSHIPISLRSEESPQFPWERLGDFEVQMDPQTRQVVNIRTRIATAKHKDTMTHSEADDSEQSSENSREQQGLRHYQNFNPDPGPVRSTTEVNQADTVAAFPVQMTSNHNPINLRSEESEEHLIPNVGDYKKQQNQEAVEVTDFRMQITTSSPDPTSMNVQKADSSTDDVTHTDIIAAKLPTSMNGRVPHVKEYDGLEESALELENEARKKPTAPGRQVASARFSTVPVRRPSWSDFKEHTVFWVRYVDEEDDFPLEHEYIVVNPIDQKKKKVRIVNPNRDERGTAGQSRPHDTYHEKESPYFYYHYDTSNALAASSCDLSILFGFYVIHFLL